MPNENQSARFIILLFAAGLFGGGARAQRITQIYSNCGNGAAPISTTAAGLPADEDATDPVYSRDASKILFQSFARNLKPGMNPGSRHLYLKELATGTLHLVDSADGSAAHAGNFWVGSAGLSSTGEFVIFSSGSTNLVPNFPISYIFGQVYRKNMKTGEIELVSVPATGIGDLKDMRSGQPAVSADGRYIVFATVATNLVSGVSGQDREDQIVLKDMKTGTMRLVSTTPAGDPAAGSAQQPTISADGRFVSFVSDAVNLSPDGEYHLFVKDTVSGALTIADRDAAGNLLHGYLPSYQGLTATLSDDGRFVVFTAYKSGAFPGLNDVSQVYRKDLQTGELRLVTAASGFGPEHQSGVEPYFAGMSPDGNFAIFLTTLDFFSSGPGLRNHIGYGMRDMRLPQNAPFVTSVDSAGQPLRNGKAIGGATYSRAALSFDGACAAFEF